MSDLVMMLIEFDDDGNSLGKSWLVEDPGLADHLRHITTHLGEPVTQATNEELEQQYGPCEESDDGA